MARYASELDHSAAVTDFRPTKAQKEFMVRRTFETREEDACATSSCPMNGEVPAGTEPT